MNATFDHTKPTRIVALDGIYILSESGHYEPYYEPDDPKLAYPGLILAALAVVAWVAFIGIAYCAYQALAALGIV